MVKISTTISLATHNYHFQICTIFGVLQILLLQRNIYQLMYLVMMDTNDYAILKFVCYPDCESGYSTDDDIIELPSPVNELTRLPEKLGQVYIFLW